MKTDSTVARRVIWPKLLTANLTESLAEAATETASFKVEVGAANVQVRIKEVVPGSYRVTKRLKQPKSTGKDGNKAALHLRKTAVKQFLEEHLRLQCFVVAEVARLEKVLGVRKPLTIRGSSRMLDGGMDAMHLASLHQISLSLPTFAKSTKTRQRIVLAHEVRHAFQWQCMVDLKAGVALPEGVTKRQVQAWWTTNTVAFDEKQAKLRKTLYKQLSKQQKALPKNIRLPKQEIAYRAGHATWHTDTTERDANNYANAWTKRCWEADRLLDITIRPVPQKDLVKVSTRASTKVAVKGATNETTVENAVLKMSVIVEEMHASLNSILRRATPTLKQPTPSKSANLTKLASREGNKAARSGEPGHCLLNTFMFVTINADFKSVCIRARKQRSARCTAKQGTLRVELIKVESPVCGWCRSTKCLHVVAAKAVVAWIKKRARRSLLQLA